jgi:hypothetical protein
MLTRSRRLLAPFLDNGCYVWKRARVILPYCQFTGPWRPTLRRRARRCGRSEQSGGKAQSAARATGRVHWLEARAADQCLPRRPERTAGCRRHRGPGPRSERTAFLARLYVISTGKGPGDTGPGGKGDMDVFDVGSDNKLSNQKLFSEFMVDGVSCGPDARAAMWTEICGVRAMPAAPSATMALPCGPRRVSESAVSACPRSPEMSVLAAPNGIGFSCLPVSRSMPSTSTRKGLPRANFRTSTAWRLLGRSVDMRFVSLSLLEIPLHAVGRVPAKTHKQRMVQLVKTPGSLCARSGVLRWLV